MGVSMPYWYVLIYDDRDLARRAFEAYKDAGVPVLLFEEQRYPPQLFAVAAYADDSVHDEVRVRRPTPLDNYAGRIRLSELFTHYLLVDAANVPSRNIDDIIDYVNSLVDTV